MFTERPRASDPAIPDVPQAPNTPRGVDNEDELDVAPIRVVCWPHRVTIYAGHEDPPGGAEGAWAAAGCPPRGCSQAELDACPNRPQAADSISTASP